MERRSNQSEYTRFASVVRQFTPSRIEHQLLAHVFEFVVSMRHPAHSAAFDSGDARQPYDELRLADGRISHGTGRSAA